MKRALRWLIYLLIAGIVVVITALLSIDRIAKSMAEKRVTAETGMKATIGDMDLGLTTRTLHIRDFKLINPPEFGGSTFVDIPELYIELDVEAIRENRMHLKEVRFNLAEIHIVENKDGKKNTDVFQPQGESKRGPKQPPTNGQTNQVSFGGIDRLEVSLGRTKFTSERYPKRNFDRNLGVTNRVFTAINSEKELQTVGVLLAAQAGMHMLLEGGFSSPADLFKGGSDAGKETGEVIEDLVAPVAEKISD